MGGITSRIAHKLQNYNLEARVSKMLAKEKPTCAPKYEGTMEQIEHVKQIEPDAMEQLRKKDPLLDNRLKNVYVSSQDPEIKEHTDRPTSKRSFPRIRYTEQHELGYTNPVSVAEGKCTLYQFLTYLEKRQANPKQYTATKIAAESKIDPKTVEIMLSYYRLLSMRSHLQDLKHESNQFAVNAETKRPIAEK